MKFAAYLADLENAEGRPLLKYGTAENYLSKMLNLAAAAHGDEKKPPHDLEAAIFFRDVLQPPSTQGRNLHWFSRLKSNMCRAFCEMADAAGVDMKVQEVPLGIKVVREVVEAYARRNTADAAKRALIIMCTWRAGGRAGEAAGMSWDIMSWDTILNGLLVSCVLRTRPTLRRYCAP